MPIFIDHGAPRRKECPQNEVVQHGHRTEQLSLFRNQAYPSLDPLFRFRSSIGFPRNLIWPSLDCNAAMAFSKVDLPTPFGPITVTICPSRTTRLAALDGSINVASYPAMPDRRCLTKSEQRC